MENDMPAVHHIPVCPFSQRLEILLTLKGCRDDVDFHAVDITKPRSPELLALSGGSTALPIFVADDGTVLRESLVILRYLDDALPGGKVAQADPMRHAIENLLASHEREFGEAGYRLLMNQEPARRDALRAGLLVQYARLDDVLNRYGRADAAWLYERFGWAEAIFTPLFMRFWCLGWYEDFELPDEPRYARVRAWRDGCLAHPAAQQVTREEVVKLYYDYALGMGNGALAPGRTRSSFVVEPHWSTRPWPPRDKYGVSLTDAKLGLT
jgi:glutathione S-transferase